MIAQKVNFSAKMGHVLIALWYVTLWMTVEITVTNGVKTVIFVVCGISFAMVIKHFWHVCSFINRALNFKTVAFCISIYTPKVTKQDNR